MANKKFNPLKDTPEFETRQRARGMKGDKGMTDGGWETVLAKGGCTSVGKSGSLEKIRVNLNWSQPEPQGFVEKVKAALGMQKRVDLDLGCLYELDSGMRGALQPFGQKYGDFDNEPYIRLAGDDKSGASDGEDLFINGREWGRLRRVLVYAYIYEGVPCWSKTNARILISMPDEEPLLLKVTHFDDTLPVCAVALIENEGGALKITSLNEFFRSHPAMDRSFGFGLKWGQGKKGVTDV